MSTIIGEVSIPADDQGFVLMQCPLCGEFFKIKPEDYHAEDVIEIWCPSCGLKAENYFTCHGSFCAADRARRVICMAGTE